VPEISQIKAKLPDFLYILFFNMEKRFPKKLGYFEISLTPYQELRLIINNI
jgi:hypothetical protein